jgi:hypothetical protein
MSTMTREQQQHTGFNDERRKGEPDRVNQCRDGHALCVWMATAQRRRQV